MPSWKNGLRSATAVITVKLRVKVNTQGKKYLTQQHSLAYRQPTEVLKIC